jgi:hypothetical protein
LSLYTEALERYYSVFPAQQILVIDFDDLVTDSQSVFERVLDFLKLEAIALKETAAHNQATLPKHKWLDPLYRNPVLRKRMKALMPDTAGRWLKKQLLSRDRLPKLTPDDRDALWPLFEQDVASLEQLTGKSFAHWNR